MLAPTTSGRRGSRPRTARAVETVGYASDAAHRITHVDIGRALHPEFTLDGCRFRVGLRGAHQVINAAMAAVMAAGWRSVRPDSAARMEEARGSRWRMELAESADGVVVLNDAYNANPASMDAALRALRAARGRGRRIAVLGDMRELGTHSDGAHDGSVGRLAASSEPTS